MPSRTTTTTTSPASSTTITIQSRVLSSQNVFLFLISFRIANALLVATFFQPDEYYQSLEPAWNLAFGQGSGAWMTWEWKNQLRSSLHPILFAAVYRGASALAIAWNVDLEARSDLLLAAPKVLQAGIAACIDLFSFECAQRIYGKATRTAWITLFLSIVSPWQFFCSTRTFSNSLETALTAAALSLWPWGFVQTFTKDEGSSQNESKNNDKSGLIWQFRASLCLAFFAIILRPTNVLIWIPLALRLLYTCPVPARFVLVTEPLLCGVGILAASVLSDQWFYGFWTFPPYRFLHFNVAQDLAVFYGSNRVDYYFTEGLPLLLTTTLPFVLAGMYYRLVSRRSQDTSIHDVDSEAPRSLSWVIVVMTCCLTFIAHKEVRFLYPLLPICHVLAAEQFPRFLNTRRLWMTTLLSCLLITNVAIAYYTTQVHQRGVVDVVNYLRSNYENLYMLSGPSALSTVAFLMPCHSTPWRSHLIHQNISAWALTCEPPIDIPPSARAEYLDQADQFYADPVSWLEQNMADGATSSVKRIWPDKIVIFEQLVPVIGDQLSNKGYQECWRRFNTHWHDDWRRRGDVVIWCK